MQARRVFFNACASAWWLLSFCREAIKAEKPNKVKCDADEIDIFSQQDEPLFMPLTRLLVVLASISQRLFARLSALHCNVFATFSLFTLLSIAGQVNLSNCFLSQHLTQPLAHHRLNLPLQHCGLPVCSSRICRMEVGLGKMKKHLSIAARLSPALGVLF